MKFIENEVIELKEAFTADIKKEVVAFANTIGGTIYVGVNDAGYICGVENADFVMSQISNTLRDSIKPDVMMFVKISRLTDNNKEYIKVEVEQGTKKPYYLADKGLKPSGVYIRSGTSASPTSEDAIRTMIKLSDGDTFETARSLNQDLTFNSISSEMQMRNLEFTDIQMKNLGIINSDGLFTNLGLLVSDQCTHSVKFAIFQGKDKLIFRDRKEITGSVFELLNDAYKTIDFYNATKATFDGLLRVDERDYPDDAVREALLNAIVHRDYGFSGSIFINLYSDRLEFVSLGGLIYGLSLEAAMLGASQPRNEKLAALFYRMNLIEAYGTGISKIMSCYKDHRVKPLFENTDGAFRVTLPNVHVSTTEDVSDKYVPIMQIFDQKDFITRLDVEQLLEVSTTSAVNLLKELCDLGIIVKKGAGKNTKYTLK